MPKKATVESKLDRWVRQSGMTVSGPEGQFIKDMRKAAEQGVGYGWMQQIIEWEWQSKAEGAWGPEYFEEIIRELRKDSPNAD